MATAGELGERKIIDIFVRALQDLQAGSLPLGGDDVATVEVSPDLEIVVKTDMLVAKTDVPPGMAMWQVSRKAVVMVVSDFAAKGVKPIALAASFAIPPSLTRSEVEQLARGLKLGAEEYGLHVLGGDTNEGVELVIDCALIGVAKKGETVRRAGARPGDIVTVTGPFGRTAAGLKLLLEGARAPSKAVSDTLIEAVYMPKARLREGLVLAKYASACIDSSDGLAWSLHELSGASKVGLRLDLLPIPNDVVSFAEANGFDQEELALYGGEEYELIATIPPGAWNSAKQAVESAGGCLLKIGCAVEGEGIFLKDREVEPKGFEHFRRAPGGI